MISLKRSITLAMENRQIKTQVELADLADITITTINKIMSGDSIHLSTKTVEKIASSLGYSVSDFIKLSECDSVEDKSIKHLKEEVLILSRQLSIQKNLNLNLIDSQLGVKNEAY